MSSTTNAALTAISILAICACERAQKQDGAASPNIVVITVDTLRADRLGCYGFERAQTPNIDRLAKEGVRVERSIAAAPLTLPTHTSIFTGLEPPAHGVRDNGIYRVPDEVLTLAERLGAEGYRTQAFVSAMVLHRRYNLSQGFDGYDDELWSEEDPKAFQFRERSAKRTTNRALEWLESGVDASSAPAPFFLWLHFFDPHAPYAPPAAAVADAPTPYDGEIAEVDRQIGRFIEALKHNKVLDDTILVFTSDHGESLGEHGEASHGVFIYESTVRVPLIFRYPRELPAGKVFESTVRSVDIMPTLLGLSKKQPSKTQGIDLSKALAGGASPSSPPQYSESLHPELGYGMAPLHSLRIDDWTYIRAPRPELYNRATDPREERNLLGASLAGDDPSAQQAVKEQAAELEARLAEILEQSGRFGVVSPANPLDDDTVEMLQALGYMGDPGADEGLEGMDPKDGLEIYTRIEEGRRLHNDAEYSDCAKVLESVLKELPKNTYALNTLASCELKMGDLRNAEKHYAKSLATEPQQHLVLVQLGRLQLGEGKNAQARQRFVDALRVLPGSAEAMSLMGYLEQSEGRVEEAKRWFGKAMDEDPEYPQAYLGRGDLELRANKLAEAKHWYDKALEVQPHNFRGALQAGVCTLRMGDLKNAEAYLLKASQFDPDSWFPLYMLASARALQGDSDGAFGYLDKAADKGFSDHATLLRDGNMAALAKDPRFQTLLQRLSR